MFNPQPKKVRVKLSGQKKRKLRDEHYKNQDGLCSDCGRWLAKRGTSVFDSPHLSHIKSKGAGGDDSEENTCMKCFDCHINKEHGPQWAWQKDE